MEHQHAEQARPSRENTGHDDRRTSSALSAGPMADVIGHSPRTLQQKAIADSIHESPRMALQRQQRDALFAQPQVRPQSPTSSTGNGLPSQLKTGIESLSGMSRDGVKVHYKASEPAQLNAHAYAQGRVKPTIQTKSGAAIGDAHLEHETDVMGGKAMQLKASATVVQKADIKTGGPQLIAAHKAAIAEGKFDQATYEKALATQGYVFENEDCDRGADEAEPSAPPQLKAKSATIQLARSAHSISGPKSYGAYANILYQTDAVGNIDFAHPYQHFLGNAYPGLNPIANGSLVDVSAAVAAHGKENRYQHFKEANGKPHGYVGVNGSSPAGCTWHHLTTKHQMHLVDREIHRKHGHNGGVYLW